MTDEPSGERPPVVVKVARGLYRAFRDPGKIQDVETPNPELHGIQLTSRLPRNRGWGPPGQAKVAWGSVEAESAWDEDPTNGQVHRTMSWRGRAVKLSVSPSTGTVQVGLKAGDEPLDPREFLSWIDWLEGTLQGQGIVWDRPKVVPNSVEVNLDYRKLWVETGQRVKLQAFLNGWIQVYQRSEDRLRAEVRLNEPEDGELTLEEMTSWVEGMLGMLDRGRPSDGAQEPVSEQEPPGPSSDPWPGEVV